MIVIRGISEKNSLYFLAICSFLILSLVFAGCKSEGLKVGATSVPHAEILEFVKPMLEKEGVKLEIVEYDDYVRPNLDLADKQLDANYFQHIPYLKDFAGSRNLDLVWVAKVHIEPMGIYSSKIGGLDELNANDKIGIPNDVTNGGRALVLLEKAGLIKLGEGLGIKATVNDVVENPKNLQFVELEAPMLPHALPELACAVINGNYALQAGFVPTKDSLFLESGDSLFANVVVVRKGDENRPAIVKLVKTLQSPEVKKFIEEKYKGGVIPAF